MKKTYSGLDAVMIPFNDSDIHAGMSKCVLTTQLETSPGSQQPCDLTPEEFWMNEWWGDHTELND